MELLDLTSAPTWLLVVLFLAGAAAAWWGGSNLARVAGGIADVTGLHEGFIGLLLLGVVTSLPEVATLTTAALGGDAPLAVNNMLGGVSLQLVVIAAADAATTGSLTASARSMAALVYAAFLMMLLVLVMLGVTLGEVPVGGLGAWSIALGVTYGVGLAVARTVPTDTWIPGPRRGADRDEGAARPEATDRSEGANGPKASERSGAERPGLGGLGLRVAGLALVILVAGFVLTRSSEGLAQTTGLGTSFFGVVFLAGATSLPELSTATSAVRLGRPEMALGDVMGGNMADMALILLADAIYAGPPVLAEVDELSVAAAGLAILLTCVLVIGMVERRDRTVLRMGYDSLGILALYAVGVVILYHLR